MKLETHVVHDALRLWELDGEQPTVDEFIRAVSELAAVEDYSSRLRAMIEQCTPRQPSKSHNGHLAGSNSTTCSEVSCPIENADSSDNSPRLLPRLNDSQTCVLALTALVSVSIRSL